MLTAKSSESDRVAGLELGADDYVTKPFSLRELTARVRAVLRRSTTVEERPAAGYQGTHLTADFDAVAVAVDGDSIRLTRREFELLRYLVQNKNRVVSRDRLLERVWGYDRLVETRSVDVHVGRLRSKLARRRTADRNRGRAGLSLHRLSVGRHRCQPLARRAAKHLADSEQRHGPLDAVPVLVQVAATELAILFELDLPAQRVRWCVIE